LTLVDEYTHECLVLHAAESISGADVRRIVARVIGRRGAPTKIRSDNGSEFTATVTKALLERHGVTLTTGQHVQASTAIGEDEVFITFLSADHYLLDEIAGLLGGGLGEGSAEREHKGCQDDPVQLTHARSSFVRPRTTRCPAGPTPGSWPRAPGSTRPRVGRGSGRRARTRTR